MARLSPRPAWTPWTGLLRDVLDQDHRTTNAQKLLVTGTACAVLVLLATVTIVAVIYQAWGIAPFSGAASMLLSLVGGRWYARRLRRRRAVPPDQPAPPVEPRLEPPP